MRFCLVAPYCFRIYIVFKGVLNCKTLLSFSIIFSPHISVTLHVTQWRAIRALRTILNWHECSDLCARMHRGNACTCAWLLRCSCKSRLDFSTLPCNLLCLLFVAGGLCSLSERKKENAWNFSVCSGGILDQR